MADDYVFIVSGLEVALDGSICTVAVSDHDGKLLFHDSIQSRNGVCWKEVNRS